MADEDCDMPGMVYRAMLASAPAPTDEDVDALCRLFWPRSEHWWREMNDYPAQRDILRNLDRDSMRAFLAALTHPSEEQKK